MWEASLEDQGHAHIRGLGREHTLQQGGLDEGALQPLQLDRIKPPQESNSTKSQREEPECRQQFHRWSLEADGKGHAAEEEPEKTPGDYGAAEPHERKAAIALNFRQTEDIRPCPKDTSCSSSSVDFKE